MSKIEIDGYELPDYASYSSLTTFMDCGWQYVLTRAVKVPEKPSWWFVGGNTIHEATEALDHKWFLEARKGVSE
jgi:hypothetical protein